MARLRDDEVRRLMSYLQKQVDDLEVLATIEDELRSDEAEEFLREPEILVYFPALLEKLTLVNKNWQLRVISHAHLRMVQRGVNVRTLLNIFSRFIEYCHAQGEILTTNAYAIYDPSTSITLRVDIDAIANDTGTSHVVTIFLGRSYSFEQTEIILM